MTSLPFPTIRPFRKHLLSLPIYTQEKQAMIAFARDKPIPLVEKAIGTDSSRSKRSRPK